MSPQGHREQPFQRGLGSEGFFVVCIFNPHPRIYLREEDRNIDPLPPIPTPTSDPTCNPHAVTGDQTCKLPVCRMTLLPTQSLARAVLRFYLWEGYFCECLPTTPPPPQAKG